MWLFCWLGGAFCAVLRLKADLLSPAAIKKIFVEVGSRCRDLAVAQTLAAAASVLRLGIQYAASASGNLCNKIVELEKSAE